jgi:ankyrin repeat protein
MAMVELLLAINGIESDSKDDCGLTPLSWAAQNGHEMVVKMLLEKDTVDPNSRDIVYGRTPLSWGAERGHEVVVSLLLANYGIEPNSTDNYGRTPLFLGFTGGPRGSGPAHSGLRQGGRQAQRQ